MHYDWTMVPVLRSVLWTVVCARFELEALGFLIRCAAYDCFSFGLVGICSLWM